MWVRSIACLGDSQPFLHWMQSKQIQHRTRMSLCHSTLVTIWQGSTIFTVACSSVLSMYSKRQEGQLHATWAMKPFVTGGKHKWIYISVLATHC